MNTVFFATSNNEKVLIAKTIASDYGVDVQQAVVDIDEIQGEDPILIIQDKARRAHEGLARPVIVSDDSWDIPALNGFPGPYMKSINTWFKPDDFLRLMSGVTDRTVILHQLLAYYDGSELQVFSKDIHGTIIDEPRGTNERSPSMTVTALDYDNGKTIAEIFEQGESALVERYLSKRVAWHDFAEWYIRKFTE